MWSVASLQLPNVFGKFGLVLIFGALDGFCVVSESCLEFVGCNPNVYTTETRQTKNSIYYRNTTNKTQLSAQTTHASAIAETAMTAQYKATVFKPMWYTKPK